MAVKDNTVEITINRERCRFSMWDPTGCKKCLELCPHKILSAIPVNEFRDLTMPREKQFIPEKWMIVGTWPILCTSCGICVNACPHSAISVKISASNI